MPYKSRWSVPIPSCSLPTFLLTSASHTEPPALANKPCYLDASNPDLYLTRASFKLWAQRFALGVTRLPGFKPGERILCFSGNSLAVPVAFMGSLMAGAVWTAANPAFTARELGNQLKDSGACYLLVAEAALDVGIEAAKIAGLSKDRIRYLDQDALFDKKAMGKEATKEVKYWGGVFASEDEAKGYQWPELKGPDEAKNTILALNYSSGTTGVPKGVMVSHRNYVSNCIQHQHLSTLYPDAEERQARSKWLCFLPLYHAMAQTIYLSGGPMRRIPVYILPKFDFIQMLECVQRFKITELGMVPPIAVMLAKHPAVKKYDLSSVQAIGSGAAPLGSEASREVEKVWGGRLNLRQGYGMTEVTCSILGWDPNRYSDSFGVGEPNANCEAKVMKVEELKSGEQTFTEVTERGPEHRGEVWFRGPNIMMGYWHNEKATKETFSPDGERWLRTGDVAYVDKDGCFFIVDRIKELIKVKGNQVAPAELEALILDHKHIADVAVIGIPTPDGDEKPRAYCVKQPGSDEKVTEQDVIDFVSDKVIRYKRLSGGCEFVDAIPKNPSGKILRRQLRDLHAKKTQARL